MRWCFVLVLLISILCIGYTQNYTVIKPLEEELKSCKEASRRARIHLDLSKEYEIFNTEESLNHGLAA